MKRHTSDPRPDWQAKVEKVGLTYHTPNGQTYWDESACYQLTSREVDELEKAANDLHMMCIEAAEVVIQQNLFAQLGIPEAAVPWIKKSWDRDDFSLYGRFDFAYDGTNPPKMLEYNADTPTALVEAAVAQWYWLQDINPAADQFNSIHEHLVAAWKKYGLAEFGTRSNEKTTSSPRPSPPSKGGEGERKIHLGGMKGSLEDEQTVLYIQDTCFQAGLKVQQLHIEDLGYNAKAKRFVDLAEQPVEHYFKLYPWEWMWHEEFSKYLQLETTHFIEPLWKMLLSNKGLLPILWQKYPNHPNLLPAYFTPEEFQKNQGAASFVKKPKLSREGANITLVEQGKPTVATEGEYGEEGYIYQTFAPVQKFDGNFPIMGVWVINHDACGLGIREDATPITGNLSRFVPHLFQ